MVAVSIGQQQTGRKFAPGSNKCDEPRRQWRTNQPHRAGAPVCKPGQPSSCPAALSVKKKKKKIHPYCLTARSKSSAQHLPTITQLRYSTALPPHSPTVDGCNINEHILAGVLVKLQANPVILKRPRPRHSSVPADVALFTNCQ